MQDGSESERAQACINSIHTNYQGHITPHKNRMQ